MIPLDEDPHTLVPYVLDVSVAWLPLTDGAAGFL
jgi:hypothetical protein